MKHYLYLFLVLAVAAAACTDDPKEEGEGVTTPPAGSGSGDEYNEELDNSPSIVHDFDISDPDLIFYDDFNQVNRIPRKSKWQLCSYGSPDWAKYLSERYDHAYVDTQAGQLVLRAEKAGTTYFTGGIRSLSSQAFKYGKVEVKAKFTKIAQGGWPAIWMMPSIPMYSGWPQCGEIDIMEHLNHDNFVYSVIHTNYTENFDKNNPQSTVTPAINPDGWNIYGIEWTEDKIDFYLNGTLTLSYPNMHISSVPGAKQWPFDAPFYIILNQSGGGSWSGPFSDSQLPAEMRVDWVKVTRL